MAKKSPPPAAPPTEAQTGDAGGDPAHPGQKGPRLRGQKAAAASSQLCSLAGRGRGCKPSIWSAALRLAHLERLGQGRGKEGKGGAAQAGSSPSRPGPARAGAGRGSGLESPAGARRLASSGAFKCQPGLSPKQHHHRRRRNQARAGPIARLRLRERNPRGRVPHRQPTSQSSPRPAGGSCFAPSASPSAAMRAIPAPGIRFLRSFSRDSW